MVRGKMAIACSRGVWVEFASKRTLTPDRFRSSDGAPMRYPDSPPGNYHVDAEAFAIWGRGVGVGAG